MFKKYIKAGSLKANVLSMFISNLSYAFFNWLQISLVAKFTDGIVLGQYTLAIAMITPLYLFLNMQLRSLIITDNKDEYHIGDYIFFRKITNLLLIISSILIVFFLNIKNPWIVILFTLIKIIESKSEIINSYFQKSEQMHFVSKSVLFKSFLGFIGILVGLVVFNDIILALLLCLINNILVYVFYDRRVAVKKAIITTSSAFNKDKLRKIFLLALPLGAVSGIISLNGNISKFFIEESLGTEIQGVYSSISYLIILGTFVCNAIGASFAPRLSKYYSENNLVAFKSLQKKFLLFNTIIGVLACIVCYFFGKPLLEFFFNKEIAKYDLLLNWIMLVGLMNYIQTALGYTLTSIRAFKIQPVINIFGLLVKLGIIGYLINNYSLLGAIYAQLFISFVQSIWVFVYIEMRLKSKSKLNRI